jgi:hypothetical protein
VAPAKLCPIERVGSPWLRKRRLGAAPGQSWGQSSWRRRSSNPRSEADHDHGSCDRQSGSCQVGAIRETVPDTFLDRADEVINVDVTVEELRSRFREGRICRAETVEQALSNFFRKPTNRPTA